MSQLTPFYGILDRPLQGFELACRHLIFGLDAHRLTLNRRAVDKWHVMLQPLPRARTSISPSATDHVILHVGLLEKLRLRRKLRPALQTESVTELTFNVLVNTKIGHLRTFFSANHLA